MMSKIRNLHSNWKVQRLLRSSISLLLLLGFLAPSSGFAQNPPEPTKEPTPPREAAPLETSDPQFTRDGKMIVIVILAEQPLQEVSRQVQVEYEVQYEALGAELRAIIPSTWEGESLTREQESRITLDVPEITPELREQIEALNLQVEALDKEVRQEILQRIQPRLEASQTELVQAIESMGGHILYRYTILNGVAATIPPEIKAALEARTDVVEIVDDQLMTGHLNVSVPSIYPSSWWSAGYDGGIWDVGIIDSGIDDTHPGLSSHNYYEQRCLAAADASITGMPGFDPTVDDVNGHGTHVAGIVASTNATYRGVSYGSDRVLNLKAGFDNNGIDGGTASMYWTDSMACVDWGLMTASDEADTLNLSYGGATSSDDTQFARFWDGVVSNLGVPSIISAGNSGPSGGTLGDPCIAYNVMCVAAMDDKNTTSRSDDSIWSNSSRGPTAGGRKKPDLTAPGANIYSSNNTWEGAAADWVQYSGTSMAAPHVAGANMLMVDYYGVERPLVQKAILINTAVDWGAADWDSTYGWGYIDLNHAYLHRSDWFKSSISSRPDYDFYKGYAFNGDKATLVWNRRVNYAGASYPGTYYSLSDIDLGLYNEDTNGWIKGSMSSIDNVEQVSSNISANVVIKVDAWSTSLHGVSTETYALATEESFASAAGPTLNIGSSIFNQCVGDQWSVNVPVNNTGDLNAHNVQTGLSIPAGLSIVSGTNPQNLGMIADGAGTIGSWTLGANTVGIYSVPVNASSVSYGETFIGSNSLSVNVSDSPAAPALLSPANASSSCDPLPTFTWTPVSGAASYHIQVDNNSDFSSPEIDTTTVAANYTHASALSPGIYYWRVTADNICGPSSWSSTHNFTILATPSGPSLITPVDGSITTNLDLTFTWDAVPGASSYLIQVDNDFDFSSPEIDETHPVNNYTPTLPLPIGSHYWRVAATNLCGTTWSAIRQFDIAMINYIPLVFRP